MNRFRVLFFSDLEFFFHFSTGSKSFAVLMQREAISFMLSTMIGRRYQLDMTQLGMLTMFLNTLFGWMEELSTRVPAGNAIDGWRSAFQIGRLERKRYHGFCFRFWRLVRCGGGGGGGGPIDGYLLSHKPARRRSRLSYIKRLTLIRGWSTSKRTQISDRKTNYCMGMLNSSPNNTSMVR